MSARRLPIVVCLVCAAVVGCSERVGPVSPPVRVVVGSYLVADLVRQLAGDLADVRWAAESGQPYERFVPDASFNHVLHEAELVIVGSAEETWATALVDPAFQPDRFMYLERLLGGDDGASGGALWLNPRVALAAVEQLTSRLVARRPTESSALRVRLQQLRERLEVLAGEAASIPGNGRVVLGFDRRFDPLLGICGFTSVVVPVDPAAPRDADFRAVRAAMAQHGATGLVLNADLPPASAEEWSRRTGLRVLMLEALGKPASGGYESTMRANLRQLRKIALPASTP